MQAIGPEYKRYIESDRWKNKCELYWLKKGRWCKACGKTDQLHVHHVSYEHFMREPLTDLVGLCYDCHREVHKIHRSTGRHGDLRVITMRYIQETILKRARRSP